jgi:FkbM family methyltransferase
MRAMYKNVAYRLLDAFDGVHARVTRRAWFTPGASAAEGWIRAMAVSGASSGTLAGEDIVSLIVQNGVVLSGPAEQAQWTTIPVRAARMKRIAQTAGLEVTMFEPAHYALLDNIVNRYAAEFCAYPYPSLRTMNLLPGDVFIDIGAFRGYVSVKAARKVGERGKVYAIEPIDENFKFVEHHRDINRLGNVTALRAAVTPESGADTVEFFRTENQGNGCIPDHLQGDARTIQVANVGARSLLGMVRSERPDARRIICSLTTNGTEMAVAEALMDAFESDETGGYLEITLPMVFTARQARAFAQRVRSKGWQSDCQHPWLKLWRTAGAD